MAKYIKRFQKVSPFKYPHKKHQRTQTPPQYSDYRRYKPYLKKEFSNKCVYCRKSDTFEDVGGFHVEHYRPKNQFKHLETDYANLYYSCAACNRYKGTYWSDASENRVVNPCDHIMSHHLKFERNEVTPLSEPGKTSLNILRLNSPQSIKYREIMQGLIINLLQNLSRVNIKNKQDQIEESLGILAKLIGEDTSTVKKALGIN